MSYRFVVFTIIAALFLGISSPSFSQEQPKRHTVSLTGYVRDYYGPITGASVFVKNTTNAQITDIDGRFTLNGVSARDIIVVSMLGYETQEIRYKGQDTLKIELRTQSNILSGAVVTALGIERDKMALSYNVQQVSSSVINKVKGASFINSLTGKIAGVQISSGAAGQGSATRVVMRGMKSIEKSNTALYVIDGVPMYNAGSFGSGGVFGGGMGTEAAADINPEDIESVSMLTGASAAALYGSSAANGVIMITTKKGKEGRTTVNFNSSTTFDLMDNLPKLQSRYGSNTINSWDGGPLSSSNYNPEEFFRTGISSINSVSVSGGTANNQTYASVSSTNSLSMLPGSDYNRYNFSARNTAHFLKDKLIFDFSAGYIMQNNTNMVAQGRYNNPLPALYLFPRGEDFNEMRNFERYDDNLGYMVQYWPYGPGDHDLQNPYWIMHRMVRQDSKSRYMLTASLKWNITDWMNIVARARVDNTYYRNTSKMYASTLTTFTGNNGGYSESLQQDKTFYGDVMMNISKTWGKWGLIANAGASINDQRSNSLSTSGWLKYPNYFAINNLNLTQGLGIGRGQWHDQTQSVFASIEASWNKALYLTVTGRNDWPSQLAFSSTSSFFYPSVGLSGVISNLVRMPSWITLLKVRGSYSDVASPFARYLSNPGYVYDSQTHTWNKPTTYPAYDLKPELTRSWEGGLTLHLLGSLSFDVTYYRTNTYNQTIYAPLSSSTGYSNFIAQTGNIQNQGVELSVGFAKNWNGLNWDSNFTYTFNDNKIIELAHGIADPFTGESVDITEIMKSDLGYGNVAPKVILREGGSLTDIYVNHKLTRGEDGKLVMTPTEWEYAGQLAPKGNFGWSNYFSYKGVSLGIVITARIGGKVYSATQGILDFYGASEESAQARDAGYVTWEGNKYDPQEFYRTVATSQGGHGAYYLYDATNVRLQELSLQYTLPRKWFKYKASLTIGAVARNLWMIYCNAPFDPESTGAAGDNYYQGTDYFLMPTGRSIGFNVKLNF